MKKALIILADGLEDVEAVSVIDVLDRAGVSVLQVGLSKKEVISAHGIKVTAGMTIDDIKETYDAIILPGGGKGAENLSKSSKLKALIKSMNSKKKIVAAICASPAVVLKPTGILEGKKATCYPGAEGAFSESTVFSEEKVVVDGNIVTSRGPGTALLFGLKLAELLSGKEKARDLKKRMLI